MRMLGLDWGKVLVQLENLSLQTTFRLVMLWVTQTIKVYQTFTSK